VSNINERRVCLQETRSAGRFPFGRPVLPRKPSADNHRPTLLLGAYPSALHIRWRLPDLSQSFVVRALAVDNEPEVFWDGADQEQRIQAWKAEVAWSDKLDGVASSALENGSSGIAVRDGVLKPLGLDRSDVWLTDCLDIYHMSTGQARRLADSYCPFCVTSAGRRQPAILDPHPSTEEIVRAARKSHNMLRLRREIAACAPDRIITLGDAALRVFLDLCDSEVGVAQKLSRDANYGRSVLVRLNSRSIELLALTHPGNRHPLWRTAHARWMEETAAAR
jgi:hypothetical protein